MKQTMYLAEKIQNGEHDLAQTYSLKKKKNLSLRGFLQNSSRKESKLPQTQIIEVDDNQDQKKTKEITGFNILS